jgi:hypothetical protein
VIEEAITTYSNRSGETAEGSSNRGYSTHEVDGMPAARKGRTRNAHKIGNGRMYNVIFKSVRVIIVVVKSKKHYMF